MARGNLSKIALGAGGLALAAGAVAAGALLANKDARETLQKGARRSLRELKRIKDAVSLEDGQGRHQAILHKVTRARGAGTKKRGRKR